MVRRTSERLTVWTPLGPDGALYMVDYGVVEVMSRNERKWVPGTAVIWKVTRTGS